MALTSLIIVSLNFLKSNNKILFVLVETAKIFSFNGWNKTLWNLFDPISIPLTTNNFLSLFLLIFLKKKYL